MKFGIEIHPKKILSTLTVDVTHIHIISITRDIEPLLLQTFSTEITFTPHADLYNYANVCAQMNRTMKERRVCIHTRVRAPGIHNNNNKQTNKTMYHSID